MVTRCYNCVTPTEKAKTMALLKVHTRFDLDLHHWIIILGIDGAASYEWLIMKDGIKQCGSDMGFGSPEFALRDGLIAWCGLPSYDIEEYL
jgi:hypothetical protein